MNSRCESVDRISHETRFVLPPTQEYCYRRHHTGYRLLPPYRDDCAVHARQDRSYGLVNSIYPEEGARFYIPVLFQNSADRESVSSQGSG